MLNCLSTERLNSYEGWINVGMSLYELGDKGLELWDSWSSKGDTYKMGECTKKWQTFNADPGGKKLSLASLKYWAKQDTPEEVQGMPGMTDSKYTEVIETLSAISKERAGNHDDWITVGEGVYASLGEVNGLKSMGELE